MEKWKKLCTDCRMFGLGGSKQRKSALDLEEIKVAAVQNMQEQQRKVILP